MKWRQQNANFPEARMKLAVTEIEINKRFIEVLQFTAVAAGIIQLTTSVDMTRHSW